MMGLEKELKDAAASLQRCNPTAISLKAGCELFLRCARCGHSVPAWAAGYEHAWPAVGKRRSLPALAESVFTTWYAC